MRDAKSETRVYEILRKRFKSFDTLKIEWISGGYWGKTSCFSSNRTFIWYQIVFDNFKIFNISIFFQYRI